MFTCTSLSISRGKTTTTTYTVNKLLRRTKLGNLRGGHLKIGSGCRFSHTKSVLGALFKAIQGRKCTGKAPSGPGKRRPGTTARPKIQFEIKAPRIGRVQPDAYHRQVCLVRNTDWVDLEISSSINRSFFVLGDQRRADGDGQKQRARPELHGFRKIPATIKIKSPPPPRKKPKYPPPPPKTRNFMDMEVFPAARKQFFQAPVKLAQPSPAP